MPPAPPFFDAHLHVIDPRFPLVENLHYAPQPFSSADYRHSAGQLLAVAGFQPAGGVVVSGSFQGTDQEHLRCALGELGPGFVGVTMLDPDVTDAELERLEATGVRGLRLNLVRRVHTDDLTEQLKLAGRARALVGWHLELYIRSADLSNLRDRLPAAETLVFDHLGLTTAGLPTLIRLAAQGARVKATGFARGDLVIESALLAIHRANPGALMAGTDLPGTRAPRAVTAADLELLRRHFSPGDLARITYRNAVELYRPATAGAAAGSGSSSAATSGTATSGTATSGAAVSTEAGAGGAGGAGAADGASRR
jgi:hypothetical protein